MTAKIFDGVALAKTLKNKAYLKLRDHLKKRGEIPSLAMLSVGNNSVIKIFFQCQIQNCREVGIKTLDYYFSENTPEERISQCILQLNEDTNVNGILVGLPLPKYLNYKKLLNQISPIKDIDCCTSFNQAGLINGTQKINSSCCLAVLNILKNMNVHLQGKSVLVVGSSIGKLIALNLLLHNCTVTICNEYTPDLKLHLKEADITISASGIPNLIKGAWLKPQSIVIDVGVTRYSKGVVGDVDFESAKQYASWITPVPGGVGPVTTSMLLLNIMTAINLQH